MIKDISVPAKPSRRVTINSYSLARQLFFLRQRLFYACSFFLLDNLFCGKIRASLLRWNGSVIGTGCFIRGGLRIQEGFGLEIGDDVFINADCCFDLSAPIRICTGAQIAFQVTIITGGHDFGPHESRAGAHRPEQVTIGKGAWIGARAVILPGVTIGEGAVVAAGALVTKDVPSDTLAAGVPARIVRSLEL